MTMHDNEPTTIHADARDPDAEFAANLVQLMPYLRARAAVLSGKREYAEDLAQEALAKAWRARRSFKTDTNLKAWLFTILRNECYSRQRRAWRQVPCSTEFAESIPAAADGQHWAAVLSDATRALHCLPSEQRKALILVGAGGFSYDDAAELSSTAVGTVKSRVARARRTLKKILDCDESLPTKFRPANGNAMNEILNQLAHLSQINTPRGSATTR